MISLHIGELLWILFLLVNRRRILTVAFSGNQILLRTGIVLGISEKRLGREEFK